MTIFIGLLIVYLVGVGWALWAFSAMRGRIYWYNVKSALLWPRFIFFNLTSLGKIISAVIVALFIALLIFLSGCAPKLGPLPATETPSKGGGEIYRAAEIQKTGSRKDVPAGKKARNVVSQTSLVHAGGKVGKIVITKSFWPWGTVEVFMNCAQCHQDPAKLITVEQPKRPWYFWPAWGLAFLGTGALIVFGSYLRGFFAPLCGFIKRLLKIA